MAPGHGPAPDLAGFIVATVIAEKAYRLMQTAQAGSPAGLDWGVQESIAGRQGPVLVHQGSDGNWLAIAVLFPEQGTGALVVANAGPGRGPGADEAFRQTVSPTEPDEEDALRFRPAQAWKIPPPAGGIFFAKTSATVVYLKSYQQ